MDRIEKALNLLHSLGGFEIGTDSEGAYASRNGKRIRLSNAKSVAVASAAAIHGGRTPDSVKKNFGAESFTALAAEILSSKEFAPEFAKKCERMEYLESVLS